MFSISQNKKSTTSKTLATSIIILLLFNSVFPLSIYALSERSVPQPDVFGEQEESSNEKENIIVTPSKNELPLPDFIDKTEDSDLEEELEKEIVDSYEDGEEQNDNETQTESIETQYEEKKSQKSIWLETKTDFYETTDPVVTGFEYIVEEFDNLKIVFTKLPEESGKLYIEKVVIPEQIDDAEVIGDAYDITSDMQNGEFEFELYMPKLQSNGSEDLDILYSEDGDNFQEISGEQNEKEYVIATEIDHLTTYVVVRNPSPPPFSWLDMIIDNMEAEFSLPGGGTWTASTDPTTYYDTNYYLSDNSGLGMAQWEFQVIESGDFEVSAWWPGDASHGNPVDYTITYQGGTVILQDVVQADQTTNGGQWNLLGTYSYEPGITYYVRLDNNAADPTGLLAADAVRIRSTQAPTEIWVDDDWVGTPDGTDLGSDRYYGYNAFAAIQEGTDAIAEGSGTTNNIVHIAEGTYEEQIDIKKDHITLSGAGVATTTIISPDTLDNKWGSNNYPIVFVSDGSNVVFEDITINGAGKGNANTIFYGIAFRNASGTIQNCSIVDIRETPISSVSNGVSIYANNTDSITRNINILGNQIYNYQKTGIVISGSTNIVIAGNTITGIGATDVVVQNGIQIAWGATGQIIGNTIRDNLYTVGNASSVGILLYEIAPNLSITDNQIFNNYVGLWNFEYPPAYSTSPITAFHNNFYSNNTHAVDDRSDSVWDDGTEGNTWDDYTGIDLDGDGVGDTHLPYQIINYTGIPPYAADNYPLTTNFITVPAFVSPPNDPVNPVIAAIVDWTDSNGTFPPFQYEFQGFSDPNYTTLTWNPGTWLSVSEISTAGVPDGLYYIRVRARDNEGNTSAWSNDPGDPYGILLDNTDPETTLSSPANNSYWNTPISIIGNSIDYIDYVEIFYRLSGSVDPWTIITTLTNGGGINPYGWSYDWNPNTIPAAAPPGEGTYDIQALATDILGRTESNGYAQNITFDITDPVPVITQPNNNDIIGGNITVTGTINELHLRDYTLSIYPVANPGNPTQIGTGTTHNVSHTLITTNFSDGDYTIELEAHDLAGNSSNVTITITIDNTIPTVEITAPTATYLAGTVEIRGTVEDDHPDYYQLIINNSLGNPVVDTGIVYESNSFTDRLLLNWNTVLENDGVYTIILNAQDKAGNQDTDSHIVIVDNTNPVVNITEPETGDTVSGNVNIEGTIQELNLQQYTISLYLIGDPSNPVWEANGTSTGPSGEISDIIPTVDHHIDDGDYTLELYAVDRAGNYSSTTITITIDNTKPVADPVLADNKIYDEGESIVIEITGTDDVSVTQLCYQIVEIDEGIFVCEPGNGTSYTWTLELTELYPSLLQDGEYTLEYYIIDSSTPSNRSDSDPDETGDQNYSTTLTVRNVAPEITVPDDQTITEGESIGSLIASFSDPSYIPGSGNDPDDAPWTITIDYGDGSSKKTIGSMNIPGKFTIPSYKYSKDGIYTVTVTVTENAADYGDGESSNSTFKVIVKGNDPQVIIEVTPSTKVYAWTLLKLKANVFGGNEPYSFKWGGACSGDSETTTFRARPGIYYCTISITDSDGDTASDSVTLTLYPQAVSEQEQAEQKSPDEEKQPKEVLGTQDCEYKSKISGYVFIDENKNDNKDEDEQGLENIQVEVYLGSNGGDKKVAKVKTNSDGYWEIELCPGEYSVTIRLEDLPPSTELEWGNYVFITVKEKEDLSDINFSIIDYDSLGRNFNIFWCIIPLIFLSLFGFIIMIRNRKMNKGG